MGSQPMQLHMCLLECYVVAMQVPNSAGTLWLQEAMSYFSLGAGAPLDGGEFHQIPVFEEPSPAGPHSFDMFAYEQAIVNACANLVIVDEKGPTGGEGEPHVSDLAGHFDRNSFSKCIQVRGTTKLVFPR